MAVDALSRTFAALSDPTRRAILDRLVDGDATVNEIAEPFEMSLQAVSKHLMVLESAGLVSKGRDGQHRRCHAEGASLDPAIDWLDDRRQQWEDRLDRLGDHLRQIQRSNSTSSRKKES
ncbi:MAG: metalloregulator ArsR/SmtB family transcription factor [Actinomycetes bacterium]